MKKQLKIDKKQPRSGFIFGRIPIELESKKMILANKLMQCRKKKGYSQMEEAEVLGVTRQAVSRWETGESRPTSDNLVRLAELYEVPLYYLISDDCSDIDEEETMAEEGDRAEQEESNELEKEGVLKKNNKRKWLMIGSPCAIIIIAVVIYFAIRGSRDEIESISISGMDVTDLSFDDYSTDGTQIIRGIQD